MFLKKFIILLKTPDVKSIINYCLSLMTGDSMLHRYYLQPKKQLLIRQHLWASFPRGRRKNQKERSTTRSRSLIWGEKAVQSVGASGIRVSFIEPLFRRSRLSVRVDGVRRNWPNEMTRIIFKRSNKNLAVNVV